MRRPRKRNPALDPRIGDECRNFTITYIVRDAGQATSLSLRDRDGCVTACDLKTWKLWTGQVARARRISRRRTK